jgi:ABC-type lipoprotein release transport system permease subunit
VARAYASGGVFFIDTSEDNQYMKQILEISGIALMIIVALIILMCFCLKKCRIDEDDYREP